MSWSSQRASMARRSLSAARAALPAWRDSALYVALAMALFAMLFGTRRASAAEHNRGLVLAMAFESVFKLAAMLALGAALLLVAGLVVLAVFWRRSPAEARRTPGASVPIREALRLFRHPVMWVIGAIQYIRLAVVLGLGAWLPTFIVEDKGFSLQVAGLVVALGAVVTAPSNFLGGYVSDRLRRPLFVIGGSLFMLAVTTVLLPHVDGIVPLLVVIALNSVFLQFYFGPLFAVPIEMLGPRTAGLTSGFSNFFANLGGFTFVYALGAIKDATGSFTAGFYALVAMCVLGLVCTLALSRMKRIETI